MGGEYEEGQFPEAIQTWIANNPGHVQSWMSNPTFRRAILNDPEAYGLTGEALDWVRDRIANRGIDRIAGEEHGHIIAM